MNVSSGPRRGGDGDERDDARAWAPPEWLGAAEAVLAGMNERHPSRMLVLVPRPDEPDGLDAQVSVRCFPAGDSHVCSEVSSPAARNRALSGFVVLPL